MCTSWPSRNTNLCLQSRGLQPLARHPCTHNIHWFEYFVQFDVLPACKHVCWCLALLENLLTTTAWISLTAGPKHATDFCMISHLYHDLYQGALVWFLGLVSELELAHSGAVHTAKSLVA
jgi:hypothetical protein